MLDNVAPLLSPCLIKDRKKRTKKWIEIEREGTFLGYKGDKDRNFLGACMLTLIINIIYHNFSLTVKSMILNISSKRIVYIHMPKTCRHAHALAIILWLIKIISG